MTDAQIARKRLHDQHLLSQPLSDAAAIVRRLGALQSQDYPNAKWAIGQRGHAIDDAAVEQAFAAGAIIRLHILRPTWHFVANEDVRWMLALSAARVSGAIGSYHRSLELDRKVFQKSNAALIRGMRDGRQLTRAEIAKLFERARIGALNGQRIAQLLMQAELDGVICSGARRGNLFTYALTDERVPPAPQRDRDEALLDLTLRYFTTRGPASPQDFSWWSGLTVQDAKRGLAAAGAALQTTTYNSRTLWFSRESDARVRPTRTAHLLPNYDEFFVGLKDRSAFSDRLRKLVPNARVDALIGHVVLVDGQLVGSWRKTLGSKLAVHIDPVVPLKPEERKLVVKAAERLGRFHHVPASVSFDSRQQ